MYICVYAMKLQLHHRYGRVVTLYPQEEGIILKCYLCFDWYSLIFS